MNIQTKSGHETVLLFGLDKMKLYHTNRPTERGTEKENIPKEII